MFSIASSFGVIQNYVCVKNGYTGLLTLYLIMPILGPSNSTANKDMISKIWTNGDTII